MNNLIRKLRNIRDQAQALPSLEPGDGYDALGFALCDLVAGTKMDSDQRRDFFTTLQAEDPDLLNDLQHISIDSEAAMDRFHAQAILERLTQTDIRAHILSLPAADRLPAVLHEYPHGWMYGRTTEITGLLQTLPTPTYGVFYLLGRSNLPLSALAFHMVTGQPVIWCDPYDDSANIAHHFIQALEEFEILKPGAIVMKPADADFIGAGQALMVLDDNLMLPSVFAQARAQDLPIITVDPRGLAQLMYPYTPPNRPALPLYKAHSLVLAQHAADEPTGGIPARVAASPDMFLSLGLYRPA